MKVAAILTCAAVVTFVLAFFANAYIAPMFFDSRVERLHETGLPKIMVEKGGSIHCRMKADDFRFPLPPGSWATNAVISGSFDAVDGSVEARFDGSKHMTSHEYETWLSGKVQVGGWVTCQPAPDGLLIKFHYFGDR